MAFLDNKDVALTLPDQVRNDGTAVVILTLIVIVILTNPLTVILTIRQLADRIISLVLTQIPDQVRNDANRSCHSDESIVLMKIRIIPLVLTQIPDSARGGSRYGGTSPE